MNNFIYAVIQTEIVGAILSVLIIVARRLLKNVLPKQTRVVMWDIFLIRMLILFTIPITITVPENSFLADSALATNNVPASGYTYSPHDTVPPNSTLSPHDTIPSNADSSPYNSPALEENIAGTSNLSAAESSAGIDMRAAVALVWIIGAAVMLAWFGIVRFRLWRKIRFSEDVTHENILQLVRNAGLKSVRVRKCDTITSPLTCGVFRPVILLPSAFGNGEDISERLALIHEITHLKRGDTLRKAIAVIALSVHWFNPFVWVGIILMNRDIELACDEAVLGAQEGDFRKEYALTLISMKEKQRTDTLIQSNFGKNAIEERIVAIMKNKDTKRAGKVAAIAALTAAVLLTGLTACSVRVESETESNPQSSNSQSSNETITDTEFTVQETTAEEETKAPESNSVTETPVTENLAQPLDSIPASAWTADPKLPESGFSGLYLLYGEKGDNVYSVSDGEVEYAGWYYGWGSTVSVCHDDGTHSFYAHLYETDVKEGDRVTKGEKLGTVGSSGYTEHTGLAFFRSNVCYIEDSSIYDSDNIAYDAFDGNFYTLAESDSISDVTAVGANLSAALSFGENDKATLIVTVGETTLSRELSGEYLQNATIELVQINSWNIAALRTPSSVDGIDNVELFYFTENTLQALYYPAGFNIPHNNIIIADVYNDCFYFTNANGETDRFTVVYDEFDESYPFRLRNADYVETAVIQSQDTSLGEVRFSYNTYGAAENGIVISNRNFVELLDGSNLRCEVRSPVYQGAGNYDNLTTVCAPLTLEVLDFNNWGIAAVRVPYPEGAYDVPAESLSLVYFDASKIMLLDNGLFIPDIEAGSGIVTDTDSNSFTLSLKDGTITQYFVSPETGCITERAVINA